MAVQKFMRVVSRNTWDEETLALLRRKGVYLRIPRGHLLAFLFRMVSCKYLFFS